MHALLTLHDVMPDSLASIEALLTQLPVAALPHTTLLIVPGLAWETRHIERLKDWRRLGLRFAGHGWLHKCGQPRSLSHWLHAAALSRTAAEHLGQSRQQLCELLIRCHQWFVQHELPEPDCYVPPAWAMGKLAAADFRTLPFRYYEDLWSIRDVVSARSCRLPLVGFEADTRSRQHALRAWNAVNRQSASPHRPLRIAVHPKDPRLRLSGDLSACLAQVTVWRDYADVLAVPEHSRLHCSQPTRGGGG